jgi:nucleotidyltransferase/DNA polymerase involved in DNA repair
MAGYIATKLCPHRLLHTLNLPQLCGLLICASYIIGTVIFVEPDFSKYQAASESIMNILRQYDPNLAPHSLDECYMNLVGLLPFFLFMWPYILRCEFIYSPLLKTMYCRDHNLSAAEATSLMRQHVLKDTGLTVSAGIG